MVNNVIGGQSKLHLLEYIVYGVLLLVVYTILHRYDMLMIEIYYLPQKQPYFLGGGTWNYASGLAVLRFRTMAFFGTSAWKLWHLWRTTTPWSATIVGPKFTNLKTDVNRRAWALKSCSMYIYI